MTTDEITLHIARLAYPATVRVEVTDDGDSVAYDCYAAPGADSVDDSDDYLGVAVLDTRLAYDAVFETRTYPDGFVDRRYVAVSEVGRPW